MTVFWIILGCVAVLFIIFCLMFLTVEVRYDTREQLRVGLRLWRVTLYRYPSRRKKKKKEKEKREDIPETTEGDRTGKMSFSQIKEGLRLATGALERAKIRHRLSRIKLRIAYGSGDAASTAIAYGGINAAVYTLIGVYSRFGEAIEQDIVITPDFDQKSFDLEAEVFLSARVGNIMLAIIRILVYLIDNREILKKMMRQ